MIIKFNKSVACLSVFSLLIGCSDSKNETASIRMPLLKECVETVVDYKDYLLETYKDSDFYYDMEIEYFDKLSYAHPSIVGYIKLISYGDVVNLQELSNFESLEVKANSIMAECYPNAMFPFNAEDVSLTTLNDYIQSNIDQNINKNYVLFEGEEIKVYFNQQNYNLPE